MFVLTTFRDTIRVPPASFDLDMKTYITRFLNEKLSNKVYPKVGLCMALFDIGKIEDAYILPGDGAAHARVEFRYVVFHPFTEEIIIGKIKGCSKEGVYVTLGFFDDIFIPAGNLQHPSKFSDNEQVWVWEYDNDGETHDLFMDQGELIRFRVVGEAFSEVSPTKCPDEDKSLAEAGATRTSNSDIPYTITASINEPGLGLLSWWEGS